MIEEVSQTEFEVFSNYRLGKGKVLGQFFYKVVQGDHAYYLSSVFKKERFLFEKINEDILLCPEDRVFIFSKNGDILLALNVWESIESIRYVADYIFLFSERGLLKIGNNDYGLYQVEYFSDIIVSVEETNEGFKVTCFDERVFLVFF